MSVLWWKGISFHEINSGSKAISLIFFFPPAVEFAGTVPKAIGIILVKKTLKLLESYLLFFLKKTNKRESVGGKTLTNVQNLFFSSNVELCFLSAFSGECCCQYVQPVIFGEPLIILAPCFQSLPFQTVLKSCIVKRQQVCSGIQAIYSGIMWKIWFQSQLSLHSFHSIQPSQLPQFLNFFFSPEFWPKDTQPRAKRRERLCGGDICDMVRWWISAKMQINARCVRDFTVKEIVFSPNFS